MYLISVSYREQDDESNVYEDVAFEDLSGNSSMGMEFHAIQYD